MIVRYLPLILILSAIVLALAPIESAAREQVQAAPSAADSTPRAADPADRQARPKKAGAPVNADDARKALPPGADSRQVRPAEAFPPERIQTPQAPSRGGVDTLRISPKDDPRSVEERKDPGD